MTERILTCEEHGEVLERWRRLGLTDATLICFDRHLDLKPLPPRALAQLDAAMAEGTSLDLLNRPLPFQDDGAFAFGLDNFLYAAIHLGFITRLIWVYPEPRPLGAGQLAEILWSRLSLISSHGDELLANFRWSESHAASRLAGVPIEVTTVRRLPVLLDGPAWIDFDLDYFATEDGQLLEQPQAVLDILGKVDLPHQAPTMTYSVSSGFLPAAFEWVGDALASGLGMSLERVRSRVMPAARAQALAGTQRRVERETFEQLLAEELEPLGGAGLALAAVLATRIPDIALAEQLQARARAQGEGAYWAAYAIGLSLLESRDYAPAMRWLRRAQGQLHDTVQQHAACLEALCLARLERWSDALALATRCATRLPMRDEPVRIAAAAAAMLGDEDEASRLRAAMPRPPRMSIGGSLNDAG